MTYSLDSAVSALDAEGTVDLIASVPAGVLTVADSRQAQERGSMITFLVRSQRLRFEVAVPPATESRIRLSALLLTAATRVVRERR